MSKIEIDAKDADILLDALERLSDAFTGSEWEEIDPTREDRNRIDILDKKLREVEKMSKSQAKRIASLKGGETSDIYDDLFVGDPGECPDCGESYQWVRPGKSQPVCDCWETCPTHGPNKIVYHPEGEFENISGYFCGDCEREWRENENEAD